MLLEVFLGLLISAEAKRIAESNNQLSLRSKRNVIYYMCGYGFNQFYSLYPCKYYQFPSAQKCSNGGTALGVGCNYPFQCTPYSSGQPSTCLNGCCCTVPNIVTPKPTVDHLGYCYNGQRSEVRCQGKTDCEADQTCMNGLCCTTQNDELRHSCAGSAALDICLNNSCRSSLVCTTSNYCCECSFGTTTGSCSDDKDCPAGYACSNNKYCCPFCPNGNYNFILKWNIKIFMQITKFQDRVHMVHASKDSVPMDSSVYLATSAVLLIARQNVKIPVYMKTTVWRVMGYLHPEEELSRSHYIFTFKRVGAVFVIYAFICIMGAIFGGIGDVEIPKDNIPNKTFDAYIDHLLRTEALFRTLDDGTNVTFVPELFIRDKTFSFFRSCSFLVINCPQSYFLRLLALLFPVLATLESLFRFWITSLHQDCDRDCWYS
uniref:Disintegrin domain-containing protein n=1 Tax=Heterorhabditis bacteriophora TaxID=37862 RepID=A0A1I7WMW9_HETBA